MTVQSYPIANSCKVRPHVKSRLFASKTAIYRRNTAVCQEETRLGRNKGMGEKEKGGL